MDSAIIFHYTLKSDKAGRLHWVCYRGVKSKSHRLEQSAPTIVNEIGYTQHYVSAKCKVLPKTKYE